VGTCSEATRRAVAERTAPLMFWLALLYLAIMAALIIVFVDVPRLSPLADAWEVEEAAGAASLSLEGLDRSDPWSLEAVAGALGGVLLIVLALLWPVFPLEFAVQFLLRDRARPFWAQRYRGLAVCVFPPFRLGARHGDRDDAIWLPFLGWQQVNHELRYRLERAFSGPMIVIALLILPVLIVEYGLGERIGAHPWLRLLLHLGTGLIWFAFATEFIVMAGVSRNKLRYCGQHWLDIAIIILPAISFLRSLRAVRAARLARLARLQHLAKLSRVFRLRGLLMRAMRALLLLDILSKVLRLGPEKRLQRLRERLLEIEAEAGIVRSEIACLENLIAGRDGTDPRPG